jgi:PEP-CTERM motif
MNPRKFFAMRIFGCVIAAMATAPGFAATTTFDFAKFSGSASDFKPNEVLNVGYFKCTNGDNCSSNLDANQFGGDLKFTAGGINVAATGFFNDGYRYKQVTVVQDKEPNYNAERQVGAGLGVYHKWKDNADDNVTSKERLVLTFDREVRLESLMMRSEGHDTSWKPQSTFFFNGVSTILAGSINNINAIGHTFTFEYGGKKADQFYLSGMVVSAVPEPETYAMMLLGLGALGMLVRRRRVTSSV